MRHRFGTRAVWAPAIFLMPSQGFERYHIYTPERDGWAPVGEGKEVRREGLRVAAQEAASDHR